MNGEREFTLSERLGAIAAFLPKLEDAEGAFGTWEGGDRTESGAITMPFVDYSEIVTKFSGTAYGFGWVRPDVNWTEWQQSAEAIRLRDEPGAIEAATEEQLVRLLTVVIRQDRFSEGTLLWAFESGMVTRIVRRAAALLQEVGAAESPGY